MSFTGLLDRRGTVTRKSAVILAATAIQASHVLSGSFSVDVQVVVEIAGATVWGTVTVSGTEESLPVSGVLTFTKDEEQRLFTSFNVLTGLTTSGFTGGTIAVTAVTRSGEPVQVVTTVSTDTPVRISTMTGDEPLTGAGAVPTKAAKLFFAASADIEDGDDVAIGSQSFRIIAPQMERYDSVRLHHFEVLAEVQEA